MILILMIITGAVYPAIDLTAGERERGRSRP
jgi:ABC-2 type transport system permease protein/sodium transport system permease protein